MNNQLNPLFRNILNAAAPAPRECAECRILLSVIAGTGHAHDCSQFAGRTPVPYNADGFYRAPRVAAIAFAMKEAA